MNRTGVTEQRRLRLVCVKPSTFRCYAGEQVSSRNRQCFVSTFQFLFGLSAQTVTHTHSEAALIAARGKFALKGQNKGAGIDGREGATGWKNNISLYASGLHRIRRAVVNLGAAELRVRVEKKKPFRAPFSRC